MLPQMKIIFIIVAAFCTFGLGVMPPTVMPAHAGLEDVALFQEELARFGQWLTYGNQGMVWRPTQVDRNWRPYTNGRWAPSQEGYVFETDEPWGWATYHYGNWLPTNEHGWVWVPGRTWYPHTVNWRSNDDNVGWSPVPPPDYLGAEGYDSGGYGPTSGYGSSSGLLNLLSPNYWMFTRASDFLQGYGQPYSSRYSYANSGLLAAPQYVPTILQRTVYVSNYVYPSYAPRACYNWGPPVTYITKVTNIKKVDIDYHLKGVRLAHLRNVMPPASVAHRHPAWREVMPAHDDMRHRHIRTASHTRPGPGALNRPDAIPAPPALVRRPDGPGSPPQPGLRPPPPPLSPAAAANPQPSVTDRQPWPRHSEARPDGRRPERLPEPPPPRPVANPPAQGVPYPNVANPATPTAPPVGDAARPQPPAAQTARPMPPHRAQQRVESPTPRGSQFGPPSTPAQPPDRQQLEQQWRGRQQRLEMEQRQRQAAQDQQRLQMRQRQEMQMEQHRRQAEVRRQQQLEQMQQQRQLQQQRQAEIQRFQQMQQQRQAEMQRQQQMQQQRQLEIQRQQQMQQQRQVERRRQPHQQAQMIQQAPPPPGQKRRDN